MNAQKAHSGSFFSSLLGGVVVGWSAAGSGCVSFFSEFGIVEESLCPSRLGFGLRDGWFSPKECCETGSRYFKLYAIEQIQNSCLLSLLQAKPQKLLQ